MFIWFLTVFILGLAIGSFLNVIIDRSTREESILGRSYCDHCRAQLGVLDLVPILSFIILGTRCRYCKKPISWQYPIIEILTGILFTMAFLVLALSAYLSFLTVLYYFFLISILIVVAVVY